MLVTGIIGAFASTASYLQERKKRKAEKAKGKKQEMKRLQIALESAQPQIQHEYDVNFARIGPRFAAGDAIAREQLTVIWRCMISALEQQLHTGSFATQIEYSSLLRLSERSKIDSIAALISQSQRLHTAAPVARLLSHLNDSPRPRYSMSAKPQYTLSTHASISARRGSVDNATANCSSGNLTSSILRTFPDQAQSFVPAETSTHIDTPDLREGVLEHPARASAASSAEPAASTPPLAPDNTQHSLPTDLSTHINAPIDRECVQNEQAPPGCSNELPRAIPTSSDETTSTILPTISDNASTSSIPTDLSTIALDIYTSTQSTSPSQDRALVECPTPSLLSESLEQDDDSVDYGSSAESASTKQRLSATDNSVFAHVLTIDEGKMIERIYSLARKAISTSETARVFHNYLVPPSAFGSLDTAFARFLADRLVESMNTLERGAEDLLQMVNDLAPTALQASSEAQWYAALVEDRIAATNKLIAFEHRLLLGPDRTTEYTSSDQNYWMNQHFKPWS